MGAVETARIDPQQSVTKPIRVVMLVQSYHLKSYGGAERQIASLAPLLKARGVDVHVIARRHKGRQAYEELQGVSVHRAPVFGNDTLTAIAYTLFTLLQIYRLKPNVIHAHGLFSTTMAGVTARRFFHVPLIAKALRSGVVGDVIRIKQKPMAERRIATLRDNVDGFVTISQEIHDELVAEGIPEDKCHYIPNGVDLERFTTCSPSQKQQQRAARGLADAPIVVYVGRLVPEKRVDNLITSWKTIHQEFPDAQLLIVGTGSEESALREMAGPGIRFTGRVDDVPGWLQIADVFVLPSVSEGLSNSLLEAMAAGLPIVASAVGEAPHLIKTGETGWLIPPDDVPALTDALRAALENLAQAHAMGERNHERIVSDFQLSVTADKLVHLYHKVTMG